MPQAKRAKRRPKKVKRVLNVVPSRDTERDWELEQATAAGVLRARRRSREVEGPA